MSKPMQILVVEDEPIIADDIVFMLEEMGYENIQVEHSGEAAMDRIKKQPLDLVLLDINLEDKMDGVDVAEILHQDQQVPFIFLTSLSDEKTIDRVKKTNPAGFLVKPIDEKDLRVNIELTLSNFQQKQLNEKKYPHCYYVKDRTKMTKVHVADILYLKGSNNYTEIHTKQKKYVISLHLKRVMESLDPNIFVRIHKGAIIHIDKVEEIEDAHVKIGDSRLAIGRTFRENFLSRLNTF